MRLVVDASVAVEILLRTSVGQRAAAALADAILLAPELLDAEVLAVLRREVLSGRLDEERALEAVCDLRDWDIDRLPHADLLERAWSYRHNATAYDALYLAVADASAATVLTADGPLSRIPIAGVVVQNVTTLV